jgi:hypothetical protein
MNPSSAAAVDVDERPSSHPHAHPVTASEGAKPTLNRETEERHEADEFDYSPFVLRTDRAYPPVDPAMYAMRSPDVYRTQRGDCDALLTCIVGIWTQLAIPSAGVGAMAGVLQALLGHLESTGVGTLFDAGHDDFLHFVTTNPVRSEGPDDDEMRLRRNSINGALLALQDAALIEEADLLSVPKLAADRRADGRGTARGKPAPRRARKDYDNQVHVRPATHDEMLLIRLATRLIGTSRGVHRAAAAVAACSSSATTSEAAQIIWQHHQPTQLHLLGRRSPHGHTEANIAPRTIDLDDWAAQAFTAWRTESGSKYPLNPHAPALHSGTKGLTSNSAGVSIDQQVKKAMTRAGLDNIRGLSAGSLRLWAATKDATDVLTVRDGAVRAGIRFATLHRLSHQLGEIGF